MKEVRVTCPNCGCSGLVTLGVTIHHCQYVVDANGGSPAPTKWMRACGNDERPTATP